MPKLWIGSQIIPRPFELANAGPTVKGVAADGTARLLLRISSTDGGSITANLVDDSGGTSTSTDEIGGLTGLSGGSLATSVSLTAHDDGYGAYAYALYQAPINFARSGISSDETAIQRIVKLHLKCADSNGTTNAESNVTIVRPPVILIHGLWSSASEAWKNFVPVKDAENALWAGLPMNSILAVNYDVPPDDVITSTDPSYSESLIAQITRNALGFSYNAPFVFQQMNDYMSNFRQTFSVAAVKADVVAHSMGGDITRKIPELTNFQSSDNYGEGSIHKLITIGTPHLGTPLAVQLLDDSVVSGNRCVRALLARAGSLSLNNVTFQTSPATSGAVADLQGSVSTAIPFPIAYIAGSTSSSNLAGLGITNGGWKIVALCSPVRDPLALKLNSQDWPTVFNAENDGIVPVTSQLNGTSGLSASLLTIPGVIHSPGIEGLGFSAPSEIDSGSGIPDWVVDLLNEPVTGNEFQH